MMKNFSVFLEEINGTFIKHGGVNFKVIGWEFIEPGYYKVLLKTDEGVIDVRVRDKELKRDTFLFHLFPYDYKLNIAKNILLDRAHYLYRFKQMKDNIPNDFVDISKNAKNVGLTTKEVNTIIEKMSKE